MMEPGEAERRPERLIQSSWSAYPHRKWALWVESERREQERGREV